MLDHLKDINIDELISDRQKFYDFVYTPLDQAVAELSRRKADKKVVGAILKRFDTDLPLPFHKGKRIVLARPVATPNYETLRFISISDALEIDPLFFEYHDDKLIFKNPGKYALGKLHFHKGMGKKGGHKIDHVAIVDFDKSHGHKISQTVTKWTQKLSDFHQEFFLKRFPNLSHALFNGSQWYFKNGEKPEVYYFRFLLLFIHEAILFENFLLDQKEVEFTKTIFLPAFIKVIKETGRKPLIVSLEPTEIEGDEFWLCYPSENKEFVENKFVSIPAE